MVRLFVQFLLFLIVFSSATHANIKYVVDQVGVLSPADTAYLSSISRRLDVSAKAQVITLVTNHLEFSSIEDFANRVYISLGLDYPGTDAGVLMVVAVADQQVHIMPGSGLDDILLNVESEKLIDQIMTMLFKTHHMREGVIQGHLMVSRIIAQYFQVPLNIQPLLKKDHSLNYNQGYATVSWAIQLTILTLLILSIIIWQYASRLR